MRTDNTKGDELAALVRRIEKLERQAPLVASSITRGQLRVGGTAVLLVDSEGGVIVHGLIDGDGTFTWAGAMTNTGPVNLDGDTTISQNLTVEALTRLLGALTLEADMTLENGGKITVQGAVPMVAGPTIYGAGLAFGNGAVLSSTSGGGVSLFGSTGAAQVFAGSAAAQLGCGGKYVLVTAGGVTIVGNTDITGSFTSTSKSFKIPHPLKERTWLLHGVTESPVHGVEYWGDETIGADGTLTIELPDYFEALTRTDGRSILVTGRGFCADWSDIEGNHFTVTGKPNGRFSWLVKASRSDVILDTEVPMDD